MSEVLRVENISVSYGSIQAIKDVSLEVNEGETIAIVGSNGAGKTTLLKSISRLLPLQSGKILFFGEEVRKWKPFQLTRKGMVHIPEGRGTLSYLTVWENLQVAMGNVAYENGEAKRRLEEVYGYFPRIKERLEQPAGNLSGGEQQMLAIARILRTGAQLILLDEPTEGLAPVIVQQIGQAIRTLKERGFTIVLVEQNFRFATKVADRHYVMEHGCVVDQLSADEARRDPARIARRLGV